MIKPTTAECIEWLNRQISEAQHLIQPEKHLTTFYPVILSMLAELQVYKDCCDMSNCRKRYNAAQEMAKALDKLEDACPTGCEKSDQEWKDWFNAKYEKDKALTAWREAGGE